MKTEENHPASRLAIARRQPGADLLADEQVRTAITAAGYGALPLGNRKALHVALTLVQKDDPERFTNLVDVLRATLEPTDVQQQPATK
jgi:hypothetical protein